MRDDERKQIEALLGVPRMARLGKDWERHVDALEALIGLASWRSQPIGVRATALVDALDATQGPVVFKRWGSDGI